MKKENKLKENTLNNKNDVLADSGKITAVKAGMIFPVTAPPIPSGVMLIRDGKIMALGEGIPIPEGAAVLDYSNAYLRSGIIDAGSHLGVNKEPYGGEAFIVRIFRSFPELIPEHLVNCHPCHGGLVFVGVRTYRQVTQGNIDLFGARKQHIAISGAFRNE